jgi:hypothetical protein
MTCKYKLKENINFVLKLLFGKWQKMVAVPIINKIYD